MCISIFPFVLYWCIFESFECNTVDRTFGGTTPNVHCSELSCVCSRWSQMSWRDLNEMSTVHYEGYTFPEKGYGANDDGHTDKRHLALHQSKKSWFSLRCAWDCIHYAHMIVTFFYTSSVIIPEHAFPTFVEKFDWVKKKIIITEASAPSESLLMTYR